TKSDQPADSAVPLPRRQVDSPDPEQRRAPMPRVWARPDERRAVRLRRSFSDAQPEKLLLGVRPAFRERQGAGAEGPALPLPFPGTSFRLDTIARQAGTESRHENRANTVAASRHGIWLRVNQHRRADVMPGQAHLLASRHRPLGPEIPRVARLAEFGIGDG